MFCPKCGEKNPDGAKFCARCGSAIAVAGPAPGPVPGPTPFPPRRRSRVPLVVAGVVAVVAVVVMAVLVLPGLLGGGRAVQERQASNASLAYGRVVASSGDCDYLYSSTVGGLCRVKHDGSGTELVRAIDSGSQWVSALAADGDTLFFVLSDYSGDNPTQLHSIRTDGSQEKVLMTATESQSINQVCVYDRKLYVSVMDYGGDQALTKVSTMSEDGTGMQQVCSLPASYPVILSDAVYYVQSSDDSYELCGYDLNTKQTRTLYVGTSAYAYSLGVGGDRLVFLEGSNDGGGSKLVSINMEGQDRKVLWTSLSDDTGASLLAVSGDSAFLAFYGSGWERPWSILRVPLDGSEGQTVAQNLDFYNPSACDMGGRLVICENGGDISGVNMRAMSMNYDGTNQVTYPLG